MWRYMAIARYNGDLLPSADAATIGTRVICERCDASRNVALYSGGALYADTEVTDTADDG